MYSRATNRSARYTVPFAMPAAAPAPMIDVPVETTVCEFAERGAQDLAPRHGYPISPAKLGPLCRARQHGRKHLRSLNRLPRTTAPPTQTGSQPNPVKDHTNRIVK